MIYRLAEGADRQESDDHTRSSEEHGIERQFWKEVATGASSEDAGAEVGMSQTVGAL